MASGGTSTHPPPLTCQAPVKPPDDAEEGGDAAVRAAGRRLVEAGGGDLAQHGQQDRHIGRVVVVDEPVTGARVHLDVVVDAERGLADIGHHGGHAAAVTARLGCQQALHDVARSFEFLLTEAALRYRPAPPPMRTIQPGGRRDARTNQTRSAQLDHLAAVVTLGTISFGVIPADARMHAITAAASSSTTTGPAASRRSPPSRPRAPRCTPATPPTSPYTRNSSTGCATQPSTAPPPASSGPSPPVTATAFLNISAPARPAGCDCGRAGEPGPTATRPAARGGQPHRARLPAPIRQSHLEPDAPSLRSSMLPPGICAIQASRMRARTTSASHAKNSTTPGDGAPGYSRGHGCQPPPRAQQSNAADFTALAASAARAALPRTAPDARAAVSQGRRPESATAPASPFRRVSSPTRPSRRLPWTGSGKTAPRREATVPAPCRRCARPGRPARPR